MNFSYKSIVVIALSLSIALADEAWSRGFGGFHGGGGMRGGMGGGMNSRGLSPGGFGGTRPQGMSPGGMSGRGMPGMSGGNRSFGANPRAGGANGAGRMAGGGFPGARPNGFGHAGERPEAGRLPGVDEGRRPSQNQLGSFLGLPSDGGLHSVAGGQPIRTAAGAGSITDRAAQRSRIDGDHDLSRFSNADLQRRGDDVRRDFHGDDFYTRDWYRRYPGAWYPAAWATGSVWAATTWASMNEWLGATNTQPTYYDYGNNVTYQDNSVYMDGQEVGTADQYYQQAQQLATNGDDAKATDDDQWMPLGVFSMTHDKQTKANLILQLAVNKQGIIRGNYTATLTNDTKIVQGSVDKKTQRAAWTIGDNKDNVIETGIYNLTKDEVPILVHFGKDRTEQWLLVRVQPQDDKSNTNGADTTAPDQS